MKPYHNNPRRISDKQLADLGTWLAELGDLSGIVHDLNSNEAVGGNQRSRIFNINECETVLTEQYAHPDEQGTVGLGYVLWQGNKYAYRQVRWDERQAQKANIVANRAGGEWDFEILSANFQVDDLLAWGFEPVELGQMGEGNEAEAEWVGMPEFEQDSVDDNKIIVYFADNNGRIQLSGILGQPINLDTKFIWFPRGTRPLRQDAEKMRAESES